MQVVINLPDTADPYHYYFNNQKDKTAIFIKMMNINLKIFLTLTFFSGMSLSSSLVETLIRDRIDEARCQSTGLASKTTMDKVTRLRDTVTRITGARMESCELSWDLDTETGDVVFIVTSDNVSWARAQLASAAHNDTFFSADFTRAPAAGPTQGTDYLHSYS